MISWVLAGCGTQNVGGNVAPGETMSASVSVTGELRGGETAVWAVAITGGTPPYTLTLDPGGGTWEDPPRDVEVETGYSAEFTMVNLDISQSRLYNYNATITDAEGQYVITGGSYSVMPLIPVLEIVELYNGSPGATYQLVILSVRANEPDVEELSVSVAATAGIEILGTEEVAAANDGVMELRSAADAYPGQVRTWDFHIPVWSTDVIDGSSGVITVKVKDSWGQEVTEELAIQLPGRYVLPFHSLAAIPLDTRVNVDEPVMVVVACGEFPADKPFGYIGGIGLTMEAGGDVVDDSINPGAPGDPEQSGIDGIWLKQDPQPVGFSNWYIMPVLPRHEIAGGRVRVDVNVDPLGFGETADGGCLLNLELSFSEPGTYTLGFEEFNEVNRTFYSDYDDTEDNSNFWADISNDYSGIPNSITVH